ncbi:Fur family transcriptional regulator [Lacihabitans soyangensis]|uniref:Ferric uptake regulation protein n=2 Tax=Lacihabitans soyangensis TaxID=869394 RepID=A0AAE3H168_9BACT|nr:transcriptional repressor [Lacihabitans soyangensis]MCP9762176.1 transcriptional repressor [Lacihabitans soyangensis]
MNGDIYNKAQVILDKKIEEKGLRKTQERYRILREIYNREDHFEIEELYNDIMAQKFNISKATVYNVVELLVEVGLVTKHQFGLKHASRYEKSFGRKQHSHLICINCNKVFEFCDPRIQNIQHTLEEFSGLEIKDHSLILYGQCNKSNCIKTNIY